MVDFIVETGAGVPNANAYDTLENVTKYHVDHGNSDWPDIAMSPLSPVEEGDQLLSAIIRGTAYIDRRFGDRFPGKRRFGRTQSLLWPRTGATDRDNDTIADNEVPAEVRICTAIASLREFVSPGSLMPDYVNTEMVTQETLGPLSVSYAVSGTTAAKDNQPVITEVDRVMAQLLKSPPSLLFGERGC